MDSAIITTAVVRWITRAVSMPPSAPRIAPPSGAVANFCASPVTARMVKAVRKTACSMRCDRSKRG